MSNVNRKHVIRKKKLKSLERETRTHYGCGAYFNDDLDRYIRVYVGKRHNSYKHSLKLKSNRATRCWNRRLCYDIINRDRDLYSSKKNCKYRRIYDYWWNLF